MDEGRQYVINYTEFACTEWTLSVWMEFKHLACYPFFQDNAVMESRTLSTQTNF